MTLSVYPLILAITQPWVKYSRIYYSMCQIAENKGSIVTCHKRVSLINNGQVK